MKTFILIFVFAFILNITLSFSQTSIDIWPGESEQFSRSPTVTLTPINDVSASISGVDSQYVSITLDDWNLVGGTLNIETEYTLHVSDTAPIMDLHATVLLNYHATDIIKETHYEDFIIKTGTVISFSDPNLEIVIRDELNKPAGDISDFDMSMLPYYFNAGNKYISNLSGIEYAINVRTLKLYGNQITDLAPLSQLAELLSLDLSQNDITSCDALSSLIHLEDLNLNRNSTLVSISGLSTLVLLEKLEFGQSYNITDFSSISNLTNLKTLYFFNGMGGLSGEGGLNFLTPLTNLASLHISNCSVENIEGIKDMVNLSQLSLSNNILDDSDLVNMYNLDNLTNNNTAPNGYLDLTGYEMVFTDSAIRELAENLQKIDYAHILYDPIEPIPIADFSADDTSIEIGSVVNFTDQSENDVSSWAWDFGDEGTNSAQNPSHTYTTAGSYTVTLTVTGAGGSDTEIKTGYITVTSPTGVSYLKTDHKIIIFPNPAKAICKVKMPDEISANVNIKIFNINGKELISKTEIINKFYEINLTELTAGLYYISVISENIISTNKLIIIE